MSINSLIAATEAALRPSRHEHVIAEIAALMMYFPANSDAETLGARMDLYATELSRFPMWAVQAVCGKIRRGEGPGNGFFPSLPEIVRAVDAEVARHRAQIAKLERILAAEPISRAPKTAESKASVAAKCADFLKSFATQDRA